MSFLERISKGQIRKPPRVIVHGVNGIGKSTLAASMPSPLFIDAEKGSLQLSVDRAPELKTYDDLTGLIGDLFVSDHPYKTLVIDTVDWLEGLIIAEVIKRKPTTSKGKAVISIEDYGWGEGYKHAREVLLEILQGFDALRDEKNMGICLLAHTTLRTMQRPDIDDFQVYTVKSNNKQTGELLIEWSDLTMFACDEIRTREKDDRAKAVNTGRRVVYTTRMATHDAKNRYNLPPEITFDFNAWQTISNLIDQFYQEK